MAVKRTVAAEQLNLTKLSAQPGYKVEAKVRIIGGVGKIKQEIEQARIEADQATRRGDLAKAAEITYGRIPELERRMAETERKLAA